MRMSRPSSPRESLPQSQRAAGCFGALSGVMARIRDAQTLHRGKQVGHRQHRQHIVAAGVDQAAGVLGFDDMTRHAEREVVQRARD